MPTAFISPCGDFQDFAVVDGSHELVIQRFHLDSKFPNLDIIEVAIENRDEVFENHGSSFDLECPPFIEEAPAIMDVQATGAKSKGANRKDYHRGGCSPYAPVPVSPGAPQTQKIACFPAHDHHTSLLLNCHAESIVLQNRLTGRFVLRTR